jgi:hypothetical protein
MSRTQRIAYQHEFCRLMENPGIREGLVSQQVNRARRSATTIRPSSSVS